MNTDTELRYFSRKDFNNSVKAFTAVFEAALQVTQPPLLVIALVVVELAKATPHLEQCIRRLLEGETLDEMVSEYAVPMPKGSVPGESGGEA